jgi:hypothetical protein
MADWQIVWAKRLRRARLKRASLLAEFSWTWLPVELTGLLCVQDSIVGRFIVKG